ncbi:hypothetical protein [Modestobacter sp. SYSU DS0290]
MGGGVEQPPSEAWTLRSQAAVRWGWAALLAACVLLVLSVHGLFQAWSTDTARDCFRQGMTYSREYRLEHHATSFPFSNPCNAHQDLVPGYVNPGIAAAALTGLVSVGGVCASEVRYRRSQRTRRYAGLESWTAR